MFLKPLFKSFKYSGVRHSNASKMDIRVSNKTRKRVERILQVNEKKELNGTLVLGVVLIVMIIAILLLL